MGVTNYTGLLTYNAFHIRSHLSADSQYFHDLFCHLSSVYHDGFGEVFKDSSVHVNIVFIINNLSVSYLSTKLLKFILGRNEFLCQFSKFYQVEASIKYI